MNDSSSVGSVFGCWRGLVLRLHRRGLLDKVLTPPDTRDTSWAYRELR